MQEVQCLHSARGAAGTGAAWVCLLGSSRTTRTRYHQPTGDIGRALWAILMGGPLSKQGEIIAHNADGQRGAEWQEQGRHRDHSAGLGARGRAGDKCCACLSSQHCSTSRSSALQAQRGWETKPETAQPAAMGCKNRCLCIGNSTGGHRLSLNTAQAHPSPPAKLPKAPQQCPLFWQAALSPAKHARFQPSRSSTYQPLGIPVSIQYGTGSLTGIIGSDQVTVSRARVPCPELLHGMPHSHQ